MNFQNEQTLPTNGRKEEKLWRIRMLHQPERSLTRPFANPISYLRSFMTSRCFINNLRAAFSPRLVIRSVFQSLKTQTSPCAGCGFVVSRHRSALASALSIHASCFGKSLLMGLHIVGFRACKSDDIPPCVYTPQPGCHGEGQLGLTLSN